MTGIAFVPSENKRENSNFVTPSPPNLPQNGKRKNLPKKKKKFTLHLGSLFGRGSTGLIRKMRIFRLPSDLKELFSEGFLPFVAHATFMGWITKWKCRVKLHLPSNLWSFTREIWILIDSWKTLNDTLLLLITFWKIVWLERIKKSFYRESRMVQRQIKMGAFPF